MKPTKTKQMTKKAYTRNTRRRMSTAQKKTRKFKQRPPKERFFSLSHFYLAQVLHIMSTKHENFHRNFIHNFVVDSADREPVGPTIACRLFIYTQSHAQKQIFYIYTDVSTFIVCESHRNTNDTRAYVSIIFFVIYIRAIKSLIIEWKRFLSTGEAHTRTLI